MRILLPGYPVSGEEMFRRETPKRRVGASVVGFDGDVNEPVPPTSAAAWTRISSLPHLSQQQAQSQQHTKGEMHVGRLPIKDEYLWRLFRRGPPYRCDAAPHQRETHQSEPCP